VSDDILFRSCNCTQQRIRLPTILHAVDADVTGVMQKLTGGGVMTVYVRAQRVSFFADLHPRPQSSNPQRVVSGFKSVARMRVLAPVDR
jgi:hypothetical protein